MKKWILWLGILAILLTLSPAVLAASAESVVDDADILTDAQEQKLSRMARQLRDAYDMEVVIHTVWSLGGKSAQAYADDYYDNNGYGAGDDDSGVIFVLSMEYRDWAISTCGKCIPALSDRKLDSLLDSMSYELSRDDYYDAFVIYLEELEAYFAEYAESMAPPDAGDYIKIALIALAIGAVAGVVGLMILRSGMNTAKAQSGAQNYVENNSFALPVNRDTFIYTRTSRVRIQTSSGGRSSTHRSSSGRSHGGRSGKF